MSETALVSVIVPTYNRAGMLHRSVESVMAQTYRPIQLIVVNDGSADNTREVMDALETKVREAGIEPTFIHKENGGVSSARNEGIRVAVGDYINFLDDDDRMYPEKLERQMRRIGSAGVDASSCRLIRVTPSGERLHPRREKALINGFSPSAYVSGSAYANLMSLLVSAEKVRESGLFNEELPLSEDVEWIGRLVHVARFTAIDEPLGRYEYNPESASRINHGEALLRYDRYFQRTLDLMRTNNHQWAGWDAAAWRARVAENYEQFVKHQLYAGDIRRAQELYEKGLRLAGPCEELRKARRKLRKAKWLRLVGRRVKHPKFHRFEDIRK